LSIEHDHFANLIEPNLSQLLQSIDVIKDEWISGKEQYRLQFEEKRELALHLVTQFFRHPLFKDSTVDDYLRMERARIDMAKYFLAKEKGDESQLDVTIKAVNLTKYLTEFMVSLKPLIESNMGEEAFNLITDKSQAMFWASKTPSKTIKKHKSAKNPQNLVLKLQNNKIIIKYN